jgi:hypothetical protein
MSWAWFHAGRAGERREKSMAAQRRYDIIAIFALVICVAGYASIRSEFRLRSTMPAEFFDASRVAAEKRVAEKKIAEAYWKCAVTQIQWRYGYAHRLPSEPPPEFLVTTAEAGSAANDSALRARYWQTLHKVWGVSAVWHEQYEWNTISLTESLQSAGQWLERHMRRIVGYS